MERAIQLTASLDARRRRLGMTRRQLVRLSGVRAVIVRRILTDPARVRFEHVESVARVLGLNMLTGRSTPIRKVLQDRAERKARYIAKLVQGTQGLEASAVDAAGLERLVEVSLAALLGGKKRKLWDD